MLRGDPALALRGPEPDPPDRVQVGDDPRLRLPAPLDVNLPGTPTIRAICPCRQDPSIPSNYDLYLGFSTTGVGYFAGTATVENEGTAPAFPRIAINRAGGTSARLVMVRNERTGKEILFDYALVDGETAPG